MNQRNLKDTVMKSVTYGVLFLAIAFSIGGGALAQSNELHRIHGFRSASFGMTIDEVEAAIEQDFGLTDEDVTLLENPVEATRILVATVPQMAPGPGEAQLFYIFGATSGRLMHVNVVWGTSDTPTEDERNHIAVAGMQLARYFSDLNWKPDGALVGVSAGPSEVMLFIGVDPMDAGVEVFVSGVPMTDSLGQEIVPDGPAILRISYSARYGQPDVVSVEPGDF